MKPQPRLSLKDITNNHHIRNETTTVSIPRGPVLKETERTDNLSASVNTPTPRQSSSSAIPNHKSTPSLELLDAELWQKFHHLNNEMIVVPLGRSLFPLLSIRAVNLVPQAEYSVALTLEMTNSTRYRFSNGCWNPVRPLGHDNNTSSSTRPAHGPSVSSSATAVKPIRTRQFYTHPDGFKPGDHWMRHAISFNKIKISNKVVASPSSDSKAVSSSRLFSVTTNHKYRLQLHLTQRQQGEDDLTWTFDYPCTEFIAVTQYQNGDVRTLKTRNNPHAAAFKKKIDQLSPPVEIQVRSGQKRQRQQEQRQPQKRQRQQEQRQEQQQEQQQPQKTPQHQQQQPQKTPQHQQQQDKKEQRVHRRPPLFGRPYEGYESPSESSEFSFSDPFNNFPSSSQYNYPSVDPRYQGTPPATTPCYAGDKVWSELIPIQHHQQHHEASQYLQQQHQQLQQEQQQEPSYNPLNLLVMAKEIREYQNSQKNRPRQDADALFRDGVDGFAMFAFQ